MPLHTRRGAVGVLAIGLAALLMSGCGDLVVASWVFHATSRNAYLTDSIAAANNGSSTSVNITWFVSEKIYDKKVFTSMNVKVRIKRSGSDVATNDCNGIGNQATCIVFQPTSSHDPCYYYGRTWQRGYYGGEGYADGIWITRKPKSSCAAQE